jgi:hypothetical protein
MKTGMRKNLSVFVSILLLGHLLTPHVASAGSEGKSRKLPRREQPAQHIQLGDPWKKKRSKLIHPDKTTIILGKAYSGPGRLTSASKMEIADDITLNRLVIRWWGGNAYFADKVEFSKKWEPEYNATEPLQKFIWEMVWMNSPGNRFQSGRKIITKHVAIYLRGDQNRTKIMGFLIEGYSDCVQAHEEELQAVIEQIVRRL